MARSTARRRPRILALASLCFVVACADSPVAPASFEAVDLSLPWQTADPRALSVDVAPLEEAADEAGNLDRMRSLLVVREGRIVLERYYHGFTRDSLADVRSVTKSVVSTLVGIALAQGELRSLDLTVGELLPPELGTPTGAQSAITLRHLLTMSGGFLWDESGVSEYNNWRLSGDFIGHLLDRPVVDAPGSTFNYNSAAVHLLGVLLELAVGTPLPVFADLTLFGPLGISRRRWEGMIDGSVNGGAGLDLRPRDLARLGQLFLQGGRSGHRRILPREWVDLATAPSYDWSTPSGPVAALTYGYLWWIDRERDAFLAWGYGGQFVYVAPSRALVVVATTEWRYLSQEGGPSALTSAVLDVIVNGIVPAVPAR
ncbi:MAG: serine hydrolase [Gemmatimonadota bacterium]|jgi:CubicO group peptidase (beta-lactamase class C family)